MKILVSALVLAAGISLPAALSAQTDAPPRNERMPAATPTLEHTFEGLNLVGADISLPPFRETVPGVDTPARLAMLRHGFALRMNSLPVVSVNTLAGPVSADQQTYVGQRPYEKWGSNPILTWDMKDLHLNNAQMQLSFGLEWESWTKAGPSATNLNSLYFYKSLDGDQFEVKLGYVDNHYEFVGLQTGGSLLTGTQGVYAVLPFEVGMSNFPWTTPAFNLKWNAPEHLYVKGSLQRSPDAAGAQTTADRNRVGFRFIPKGDKLVTIGEAGYRRAATASENWIWIRGGYVHNSTPYPNFVTGTTTSGNYCAYLLGDRQFTHNPGAVSSNGIYAGGSAMIAPASMDVYTQYYEARVYDEGPFATRPGDTASLVVTHSVYSRDKVKQLIAEGKSYWRNSTTVSGSYTLRAARGVYFSVGLSYIAGAAVTPHVANALVATIGPAIFF